MLAQAPRGDLENFVRVASNDRVPRCPPRFTQTLRVGGAGTCVCWATQAGHSRSATREQWDLPLRRSASEPGRHPDEPALADFLTELCLGHRGWILSLERFSRSQEQN